MKKDDTFSFRWGIPLLDKGRTDIPNFILDHYTEAGVSRVEFIAIIHLARYQFESPESECRPSVTTVAKQMGLTVRRLQQIFAGLEKRGLLIRHYRCGQTTVYDFGNFSRAMLAFELSTGDEENFTPGGEQGGEEDFTPEKDFTPSPEEDFTPGVKKISPKEEKQEEQPEEEKAAGCSIAICTIHGARMEKREKDGAIWYSHRLGDGSWCKGAPGDQPGGKPDPTDPRRYISGKYAAYIKH